jgi:excisionase family DNA binding protein
MYVSAETIAQWLDVDSSTVYRWAANDSTVPALRIGGIVRFHRERMLTWLEQRTQGRRASLSIRQNRVA